MIRFLLSRIGCLMMIFSIIILVVGIAAVQSDQPALNLLFIGSLGTFVGFLLWNRLRERAPRSTRFSLLRKKKPREEQEEDDHWEHRFYE